MNGRLLRNVVLPAWQYVKGQNSLELLHYLERTQWLTPAELEDLQWQRIFALLQHARTHVPYYAEVMQQSGTDPSTVARTRSLSTLPVLDRSTIRSRLASLKSQNFPAERFTPNGTGGSTGEPLRFFDDRDELGWSSAAVWRAEQWLGIEIGDRCAYLWGADFDITTFRGLRGRVKSSVLNMLMLPAWELNDVTVANFWQQLRAFRPRLLVAYAGALHQFARLIGTDRDPIPELNAIIVSAETLSDDARTAIEGCFKVRVYNRYGGRDLKFVAQECPVRGGLHINAETVHVEIVKGEQHVSPGELGEIVITRLDNFAMPFIRYRTGDLGIMGSSPCSCGRSLPLLEHIEGRVQDAILATDGRIVSGLFFAHMMKDCPDVREFQVHQTARDRLLILVVLTGATSFVSRGRIDEIVRRYVGAGMQIDVDVRAEIPLTRSGKRRIVVSHLNGESRGSEPLVGSFRDQTPEPRRA